MSALAVKRLAEPGLYFVGGIPGLALQVTPSGARSWVLRAMVGGKRRDMGLGGFPEVGLADARQAAAEERAKIRKGLDPIEERKAARSLLVSARAASLTFDKCAELYIAAHEAGWSNPKHVQQWRNTLSEYASPVIGTMMVRDVELPHILQILEPIWKTKTETASRVRGRVESVLDWATTRGYREGLNPARWRGHLDKVLPKPSKVAKVEHHAALAIDEAPAFIQRLREVGGMGALALEFAILTAARSGEVRGATFDEFDREAALWTIPASRMKAGREHRVPLSVAALAVFDKASALPHIDNSQFVFAAPRGGQLSDMTLSAVMKRMEVDATPHGFRSTFRDWAAERTSYPHEMAEMALAHTVSNKVEAAYRRGDLFDKRRRMMDDWSRFLAEVNVAGKVIPMKKRRA